MTQQTPIFALDIGTRSVIGVIIQPLEDGTFLIKDIKMKEHKDRSMLDGQIHDVVAVSETIQSVKEELEAKNGLLHQVAVAAAGRSLKTYRVKIDLPIEGQPLLRKEDIRALELSAVQQAQKLIVEDQSDQDITKYHCVGYSVVNYYLDHQVIGNLIDQRGKIASVEIIATFLPRVVVDSLISSLTRADLQMEALTLEPIAAIHVLIPPSMRKLNIALVDIGAGTSDIAITADGTVVAYGMVPFAGDEITEAISQQFLLDFHIAEEIKRQLSTVEEVTITDILGVTENVKSETVLDQIDQEIENLAHHITQKILELNGKPPQAIMLVGGGSQTPRLTEKIAKQLELPLQRVAIRSIDAIQYSIIWPDSILKGPDLVTPIGIGISSREKPIQYITLQVNGEIIRLFEMKSMTIGDALIAAGIAVNKLFGKPGMGLTVKINGKLCFFPGEYGSLPILLLNGELASLDTPIHNGDIIEVTPGIDGKDATLTVKETLSHSPIQPYHITINGKDYILKPLVEINGIDADYSNPIHDRDSIRFYHVTTIEEVLVLLGYSTIPYSKNEIKVYLNGEPKTLTYHPRKIYRNQKEVSLQDFIANGDHITLDQEELPFPTVRDLVEKEKHIFPFFEIEVTFNGQPLILQPKELQIYVNKKKASLNDPLKPNSLIEMIENQEQPTFSDVFRYIDFSISMPQGASRYVLRINGEPAEFHSPIKHGDQLELRWE
ncbi:cell division protein FtsA [Tepidibacillus fermentans]|uniref:Cell division protein FtsA n=1 Tax=Tepidibacillus fermentans TaxID=1281767 RepID=A0A4R3KDF0_9BACI|nr:cell division FtsA domain-containing protein [Tepidibacillus fermentans]TCS81304.1 cell division protein FtsA [Tepidibacillus fermentans]